MSSDNVEREVQIAFENAKTIVILRLDNSNRSPALEYQLARIQWMDYSSLDWKTQMALALGGGQKSSPKPKTRTNQLLTPSLKIAAIKPLSPEAVISELESVFSANGGYHKDQCGVILDELDVLHRIVRSHWVNSSLAYKELIPRVYPLEKIEYIRDLIREFQSTCPPGSRDKRKLIHDELRTLLGDLNHR